MKINLHILKASGRLDTFEPEIQSGFDEEIAKIKDVISLPNVDAIVEDDPDAAIPETGVGGHAPTAHLLYISIDPNFPDLQMKYEIKSTLAHELHHCARWEATGYAKTLLEAMVAEGLADHFDIEMNGDEPRPWSVAVQGEQLDAIKEKAKKDFSNNKYDHSAWFFGTEKDEIPRWAGYSIGFQIVRDYIEKVGKTAGELVGEEAVLFIK